MKQNFWQEVFEGATPIFLFLLVTAAVVLIFREIVCWYTKASHLLDEARLANQYLKEIREIGRDVRALVASKNEADKMARPDLFAAMEEIRGAVTGGTPSEAQPRRTQ